MKSSPYHYHFYYLAFIASAIFWSISLEIYSSDIPGLHSLIGSAVSSTVCLSESCLEIAARRSTVLHVLSWISSKRFLISLRLSSTSKYSLSLSWSSSCSHSSWSSFIPTLVTLMLSPNTCWRNLRNSSSRSFPFLIPQLSFLEHSSQFFHFNTSI